MTRPADLSEPHRAHLNELLTVCPELTALAQLVHEFAQIMANRRGAEIDCWIKQVRAAGLIELEPFLTGVDQDHDAVVAGLTLPYSSGPIEGVNTKNQTDQTANVWPSRIRPPPTPNPAVTPLA